jgi:CO/xanthine dehydrogenase FAD-binding subunit
VLAEVGPRGKVLAGGQSVVPLLNMRLAAPAHLVDVNWLAELDKVATDAAAVRVSALSEPVRAGCCGNPRGSPPAITRQDSPAYGSGGWYL